MSQSPSLIFAHKFAEIVDILNVRYRGLCRIEPNNNDKGEVCEIFMKEVLAELLSGQVQVFRGGHIVDSHENKSKQIDVVVCWRNAFRIFGDKGLYPVECVAGAFSITSTLDRDKLEKEIINLASIPVDQPEFTLFETMHAFLALQPSSPEEIVMNTAERHANREAQLLNIIKKNWRPDAPYRCIFALGGNPQAEWREIFNKMIDEKKVAWEKMPKLVVINKVGIFQRLEPEHRGQTPEGLAGPNDYYAFVPFTIDAQHNVPIAMILFGLSQATKWQEIMTANYGLYFHGDVAKMPLPDEE